MKMPRQKKCENVYRKVEVTNSNSSKAHTPHEIICLNFNHFHTNIAHPSSFRDIFTFNDVHV